MTTKVLWTPAGVTLDSIREKRLVDLSDGDTPNIRMNVRMLSIDTPEKKPTGKIRKLADLDAILPEVAAWIASGDSPVWAPLAQHLIPRLQRANAATAHTEQGKKATEAHETLVETRLKRPTGSTRPLFVRVSDSPFDGYGRLLAYVAPSYTAAERATMTRRERATFNFAMVEVGWAAPFILFPNVPGELDLPMFQQAGETAVTDKLGAWADDLLLTGYEFRMVERLAEIFQKVKAGQSVSDSVLHSFVYRYCADISTGQIFAPQNYVKVQPWNRLFIWKEEVRRAVAELNLTPDL